MINSDSKKYTKLPIRHKKLSTHIYILYIAQELIETFYIINEQLKKKELIKYTHPSYQWENIDLTPKELSTLQGKPNTLIINKLTDIDSIR